MCGCSSTGFPALCAFSPPLDRNQVMSQNVLYRAFTHVTSASCVCKSVSVRQTLSPKKNPAKLVSSTSTSRSNENACAPFDLHVKDFALEDCVYCTGPHQRDGSTSPAHLTTQQQGHPRQCLPPGARQTKRKTETAHNNRRPSSPGPRGE